MKLQITLALILLIFHIPLLSEHGLQYVLSQEQQLLNYENPTYGIKMQYPSDWQKEDQNLTAPMIVDFYSPSGNRFDPSFVGLTISADNLPNKNLTLESYLAKVIDLYKETFTDVKIIESAISTTASAGTDISVAGNPGYKLVFTEVYTNSSSPEDPKDITQHLETGTIVGDKVYYLSYYARPESYSDYLPTVQKMINSFEMIPVAGQGQQPQSSPAAQQQLTTSSVSSSNNGSAINNNTNFLTYENSTTGIRIQYPSNWEKDCPSFPSNRCFFNVPPPELAGVMVAVFNVPLEELKSMYESNIHPDDIEGGVACTPQPTSFQGNNAYTMTCNTLLGYHNNLSSDPNLPPDKYSNFYLLIGDKENRSSYAILYAAERSLYEKYLDTAQKVIYSFEIIGPVATEFSQRDNYIPRGCILYTGSCI